MGSLLDGAELASVALALTPERIAAFSALANDRNATHYDDVAARAQGFAGALVHGAITISVALRTLTLNGTRPFRENDELAVSFLAPVSPGDTLTGRARVIDVTPTHARVDVWCENQHGVKVLAGKARVHTLA